jgi:hypothetical protein
MRTMMVVVVVAAVAVWVGMHQARWREDNHQWWVNRTVLRQLNRKVTLHHPEGVTFSRLMSEIRQQTADPTL